MKNKAAFLSGICHRFRDKNDKKVRQEKKEIQDINYSNSNSNSISNIYIYIYIPEGAAGEEGDTGHQQGGGHRRARRR